MAEGVFDFIAGWVGGCAGLFVGHPLDTVKVRQQTMPYSSMRSCMMQTYKHEGIGGFYKGLAFPFISNGLINCIFFGVYGNSLRYIIRDDPYVDADCPRVPLGAVFVAGCVGAVAQAAVITPIELVKVKLQVQTGLKEPLYRGPIHCLQRIYQMQGISGWYRGLIAQLVRDIPSSGVYMAVFEMGVRLYKDTDEPPSPTQILLSGGVAGVACWVVILPLDVIKSRVQADDPVNPRYRGMWHCTLDMYRHEGLATFGKGFWSMTIRAFPTNSVIFIFYWWTMDLCVTSWTLILPLDVIKNRVQADDPANPRYRGMFHCALDIYRHEGLATFGKGFWSMILRAFPTNSIIFLVYWWTMDLCQQVARWRRTVK